MRRWTGLVCAAVALAGGAASAFGMDPAGTAFAVSESTKVPGMTLRPGNYSIRVVDHLSDRLIVRVDDESGSSHSTFIGIQNSEIPQPSAPGAVNWSSKADGTTALRGFEFPGGGPVVEFVYPKADAVAIAKVNSSKVPAIDPASEGKVKDTSLSKDDLEVVTLWMLSSTQVGPDNAKKAAIAAEKYQATNAAAAPAPTAPASAPAPTQEVASATPPPSPAVQAPAYQAAPAPRARKPVVAKLPHTASEMPILWLFGAFSLAGAGVLGARRTLLAKKQ